jgi:hypothetical protein
MGFAQIYSIHVSVDNQFVPAVIAFTTDQTANTYKDIFRRLKNITLEECDIEWSPERIITDYERAAHSAIRDVFGKLFVY